MNYSSNIIIIIILILNNPTASFGGGTIIYFDGDGNKICSPACIALFSLIGIALAVAISFCFLWYNKRYGKSKTFSSTTNDLEQPTLPSYDIQPPAYSELSNPPPLPPTLIDSESFSDAEEFYKNNQSPDSLPSNDVIQELSKQSTYSSWKFIPEKILEQLEIVLVSNDGREINY